MGTSEVADLLGITVRALYRLIDEGELPAYKVGRLIRLRTAEVEAWRDANGGPEPG